MWKDLLRKLDEACEFRDPAAVFYLDEAESTLKLKLPRELREVLRETNGVEAAYGLALLWPLERIVEDNLRLRADAEWRSLYMPFEHLLFFADAGNGDRFAFPIRADGMIHGSNVFAWNHEDDSRSWVAPSLKGYFEGWLTGQIEL